MITLVDSEIRLERTAEEVPVMAWDLIDFTERPLTIIYDAPKGIAPSAVNSDNSLGIRLVKDPFCKKLIQQQPAYHLYFSQYIRGKTGRLFCRDF